MQGAKTLIPNHATPFEIQSKVNVLKVLWETSAILAKRCQKRVNSSKKGHGITLEGPCVVTTLQTAPPTGVPRS